jgi:hypothetical protein
LISDLREFVRKNVEERRRDREGPEMASCDSFPSHVGVSTRKVNDMLHKDTSLNGCTSLMAKFNQKNVLAVMANARQSSVKIMGSSFIPT